MPPEQSETAAGGNVGGGMSKLRGRQARSRQGARKPPPRHPRKPEGSGPAETPATTGAPEDETSAEETEAAAAEEDVEKAPEVVEPEPVTEQPADVEVSPTPPVPPPPVPRPQKPAEKPASGSAGERSTTGGSKDTTKAAPAVSAKTDAALKSASDLALAWAAGARKMSRRTTALVTALRKGEQMGVPRELLIASLVAAQRRTGEEFPAEVWQDAGLIPPG